MTASPPPPPGLKALLGRDEYLTPYADHIAKR